MPIPQEAQPPRQSKQVNSIARVGCLPGKESGLPKACWQQVECADEVCGALLVMSAPPNHRGALKHQASSDVRGSCDFLPRQRLGFGVVVLPCGMKQDPSGQDMQSYWQRPFSDIHPN